MFTFREVKVRFPIKTFAYRKLNNTHAGIIIAVICDVQYVCTVCPRSNDPFYIVSYYIRWLTTSWTDGIVKTMSNNFSNELRNNE